MEIVEPMRTFTRIFLAAAAFGLVLALPELATTGGSGAGSDLGLARQLTQGSLAAFAVAFAGGVLTSLTPCVYPLIPVTVSIFGAKESGSRAHAMALSGLYVLGIAVTYSALGASAALTGRAFGTVMQNPMVLGLVVAVFLAMAASMFGAFELQLPASLQAKLSSVGGAGYAGSFAMGLVAGLIAAPCTGPVLAAALAFVATKGSVAFGVGIMFAYALGIGLLFFLIGAFSVSLPKSGPWMDTVKSVFGVALLAMALIYLKDLFPGTKALFSATQGAALAAAAAAAAGVLLGALGGRASVLRHPVGQKLARGAGVALVALGAVYAVGVGSARSTAQSDEGIAWLVNQETEGLALARADRKPIIIDFWADWCAACKELDHTAWSDPRVREEAKRFVTIKMDNSADKIADPRTSDALDRVFAKYGILGQPSVVFIDNRGRELPAAARVTAVVDADEMLKRMRAVDKTCTSSAMACLVRW
ncbi:MAG: cytochrome C biogenesis protein [Anaeromyxobacter sp. RBG_16_69_14]|nr:MAG: cytochrome C biogenesis protein [Anaeromyxobacter sp. RBG_16_69_14]